MAYRSGNAKTALRYLDRAQQTHPNANAHALILAVGALTQQKLGHVDEARIEIDNASKALTAPPGYQETANHEVLIPQILLQEAKTNIGAGVSKDE